MSWRRFYTPSVSLTQILSTLVHVTARDQGQGRGGCVQIARGIKSLRGAHADFIHPSGAHADFIHRVSRIHAEFIHFARIRDIPFRFNGLGNNSGLLPRIFYPLGDADFIHPLYTCNYPFKTYKLKCGANAPTEMILSEEGAVGKGSGSRMSGMFSSKNELRKKTKEDLEAIEYSSMTVDELISEGGKRMERRAKNGVASGNSFPTAPA